jgi:transcriptional regulator with XRE-family HTH domain
MSGLCVLPLFNSTSAAGAMRQVGRPLIVGVMLFSWGTSGAYSGSLLQEAPKEQSSHTTSTGQNAALTVPAGDAIAELRSVSGLTWEQLARLMGVSRRALHLWASGKPIAAINEERLARVLAIVKQLDRGTAAANRGWLLASSNEGQLPFDLLRSGAYAQVLALCARREQGASANTVGSPVHTSRTAAAASPDELVDALQDRIHKDVGRVRPARGVKTKGAV